MLRLMVMKSVAVACGLALTLAGCAADGSPDVAAPASPPPDACSAGTGFGTIDDYAAGQGPGDRTGGAATPEDAARYYAATMRPPGPAEGWTRVPEEAPTLDSALVAADDYRMRAYKLVKDGTWVVKSGYRCGAAVAPAASPSSGAPIFLTNDRQYALAVEGCTACGPAPLRVEPGQEVSLDLSEGNRTLTLTGGNTRGCFTVFYGVQPAPVQRLRASEAGSCDE